MTKLALIGAALLGFHAAPITQAQAIRALRADGSFTGEHVISCTPNTAGMACVVVGGTCYIDRTFGDSTVLGSTTVEISRGRRGFHIKVVVPDHFDIYAGDGCAGVGL